MGWASGGDIFNRVAWAMLGANASKELLRATLSPLADELRNGDWDTIDESIREFRKHPVVTEILVKGEGEVELYDNAVGTMGWDEERQAWTLACSVGDLSMAGGDSAAEHDRLVHLWYAHCQEQHGGDGEVEEAYLIG